MFVQEHQLLIAVLHAASMAVFPEKNEKDIKNIIKSPLEECSCLYPPPLFLIHGQFSYLTTFEPFQQELIWYTIRVAYFFPDIQDTELKAFEVLRTVFYHMARTGGGLLTNLGTV